MESLVHVRKAARVPSREVERGKGGAVGEHAAYRLAFRHVELRDVRRLHVAKLREPKSRVDRRDALVVDYRGLDVFTVVEHPSGYRGHVLKAGVNGGRPLSEVHRALLRHFRPLIEAQRAVVGRVHSESQDLLHSPGSPADRALADVVGGAHLADELVPGIVVGCGVGGTRSSVDGGLRAVLHLDPLVNELVIGHIGTGYGCRDRVPDGGIGVVERDGALQIAVRIGICQVARIVGLLTQLRRDLIRHRSRRPPGGSDALTHLDALSHGIAGPAQPIGGRAPHDVGSACAVVGHGGIGDGDVSLTVHQHMHLGSHREMAARGIRISLGRLDCPASEGSHSEENRRNRDGQVLLECLGCAHHRASSLPSRRFLAAIPAAPAATTAMPATPAIGSESPVFTALETALATESAIPLPFTVT